MRDIRLLTLVSALVFVALGLTGPVMTVYLESLGADFAQISLILTSATLSALLFNYLSGRLSDRLGRRKGLLVASLLLIALAYIWLGRVPNATLAWPIRIVEGIGGGVYGTLSLALIGDLLESGGGRGRRMGVYRGLGSAAYALGAVSGGWLATRLAAPAVFTAAAGCYAAAAAVMAAVREPSSPHAQLVGGEPPAIEPLGAPSGYPGLGLPGFFLAGVAVWTAALSAVSSMWPNAMMHQGYSQATISSLWGLAALVEMPSMALAGAAADAVGRAPLLAAGAGGLALVFCGYLLLISWPAAIGGAQVMRGLAYGSYTANAMTYTTEQAVRGQRGSVSGVFAAVSSAGQLVGTLAGGLIVQAVGFGPLFALGALAALAAAGCFTKMGSR